MTEQLTRTIEDLATGIAAGSFRSEAEISQGVVKRVLHQLGWPVFDMQVVAPEFKIGTRKVDYALCQPPGKAAILVEVKDLGKADGKGKKQLFEYCFHQGVPIAVLTDGRTWSFFFPAGQGSYEERLFARIDLLDDNHREAATTLVRYLDLEDVKSQAARKRAERDYEEARFQKQAASMYTSVWRKLLSGPEPLLLELFAEEVENATGVKPDSELAAAFIRGQVIGAGLAPKAAHVKPTGKQPKPPPSQPSSTKVAGQASFTFRGQTKTFDSGAKLLGAVFGTFASMDPDFCRKYSKRHSGRVRKYVAKSKQELYPGNPNLQSFALPLPNGWWVATHTSNTAKLKRIKEACKLVGLVFGREVLVEIPVGTRGKKTG